MANKDSAFGLRAIGKVGQNRDNQGLSEYDIAASATAIYFNDPVKMKADGTIEVAGAGGAIQVPWVVSFLPTQQQASLRSRIT